MTSGAVRDERPSDVDDVAEDVAVGGQQRVQDLERQPGVVVGRPERADDGHAFGDVELPGLAPGRHAHAQVFDERPVTWLQVPQPPHGLSVAPVRLVPPPVRRPQWHVQTPGDLAHGGGPAASELLDGAVSARQVDRLAPFDGFLRTKDGVRPVQLLPPGAGR